MLYPWYNGKQIHVSIDDVVSCLKDISDNDNRYSSIFENSFFNLLREYNASTGCKFTLYLFEENKGFHISQFPAKYKNDFFMSRDWLIMGYHSKNPIISQDSIASSKIFIESFLNVKKSVEAFSGNFSRTSRLHRFFATQEEVDSLEIHGVRKLFSADDDRISYSLPSEFNNILKQNETLKRNGVCYERTDIRIEETLNPLYSLWRNRNDDTVVLFSHEWALRNRINRCKLYIYLWLLNIYNCEFIIE